MDTDSRLNIIESQIRELYARVLWSHKTQEKCADILNARHKWIKIIQIVLSVITTTGILITIFGDDKIIGIISAVFSALLFGINAYTKDYDLGQLAQKHSNSASDLWNLRESYLSLLTDIKTGKLSTEEITTVRDKLQTNLYNVYKGAPRTISRAYRKATKGLKENEEMTFSPSEIDSLLPEELRMLNRS